MMAKRNMAGRGHLRLKKLSAVVIAGLLSLGGVAAIAVEDQGSRVPSTAECNSFKSASQTAMQNQLSIVNQFMSAASGQMQAAVSKKNSCIGNLALLDFDMSKLIPDFGLLGMLLNTAIDKLVNGVINRACSAISSVLDKPGEIWNSIMGTLNINGQFQDWAAGIDYKIPGVGSSGSGSGTGGGPTPTAPIGGVDGGPLNCIETVNETVCTDGSTRPGGVDRESPNGAQIGAEYGRLLAACTGAMAADEAGGTGTTSADTKAACQALQNYINRYRPYLDPSTFPRMPSGVSGGGPVFGGTPVSGGGGYSFEDGLNPGGSRTGLGPGRAVFGGSTPAKTSKPAPSAFSLPVRE